jgi:hypothetical protein
MGSIRRVFFLLTTLFYIFPPVSGQTAVSLGTELQNLEKTLSASGASPAARHETYSRMARLQELSGDIEGAAQSWINAAQAEPGIRDYAAMLHGAACFAALGEWERADAALRNVLLNKPGQEILYEARLMAAQLEALRSGGVNTAGLNALLSDPAYGAYKPRIYFSLWKFNGQDNWRRLLVEEYSRSPEGRIAAGTTVSAASTAMWLLFPGRGSPAAQPVQPTAPAPRAAQPPAPPQAAAPSAGQTLLQAGLFSREANAQALIEKLRAAGFSTITGSLSRPGGEYIVVYVIPGRDINASIRQLESAGFDSFPVTRQ